VTLIRPGHESSAGSAQLIRRWGLSAHGIYPWDSALLRRSLDGEAFWVGCGCFFLGGAGEGKKTHQGKYCRVVFTGDVRVEQSHFLCYILYIEQWRFRCSPEPRCPGQYTRVEVLTT
jgi:hypothetical protein